MKDHLFSYVFALVVCMGIAFISSGMEAGVFALSRLRIRKLQRSGNKRAQVLYHFLEKPEAFLWTILVGNTVATLSSYCIIGAALYEVTQGRLYLAIPSFFLALFVYFIFCDLLPKMLFRTYPNRLCLLLARPFRLLYLVLRPFVSMVERFAKSLLTLTGGKTFSGNLFANREELRFLMQETAQDFSSEERAMINRVLDLQNRLVRHVTRPLDEAIGIDGDAPASEALEIARTHRVSRIPVWQSAQGGSRKKVIGVINLRRVLFSGTFDESKPAKEYTTPVLFLNEDLRLEEALRRMQKSGRRLAIVLGRDHREVGLISLHDILKMIFGEVSL
ncbi:MAG: putative hemolysin protein [Verrucomicrobiales bacterium]|nr:putative hemolysin protein [Verrucomicrobiales bacterium]